MVSPVLNVARWSVFVGGIAYGFVHNQALSSLAHAQALEAAASRRAKLVDEAKAEWARLHPKKDTSSAETNFEDPKFDPAKWVEHQVDQLNQ